VIAPKGRRGKSQADCLESITRTRNTRNSNNSDNGCSRIALEERILSIIRSGALLPLLLLATVARGCTQSDPWIVNADIAGNDARDTYIAAYMTGCGCDEAGRIKRLTGSGWVTALEWKYWLLGIWVGDDGEVVAVGEGPEALVYRKGVWRGVPLPEGSILTGVWGASFDDVFAVGHEGRVVHFDGTRWNDMTSPVAAHLRGIWGSAADNVYGVGRDGVIIHYDGAIWEAVPSGTDEDLTGIWGAAPDDIFAVGGSEETGAYVIVHYDGATWNVAETGGPFHLIGIDGRAPDDIVAVGGRYDGDVPRSGMLRFDGTEWRERSTGINEFLWDVRLNGDGDVIVVGPDNTIENLR
jgi:hypothetical protein